MSSAGHIFEMINKLKQLRDIKTSQKARYSKLKDQYGYQFYKMKIDPNKKKLSKKEIEIIKDKIRTRMIRERLIRNLIVSLITAAIALILYYIIDSNINF